MARRRKKLKLKRLIPVLVVLVLIIFGIYKLITHKKLIIDQKTLTYNIGEGYYDNFKATFDKEDVTSKVKVTNNVNKDKMGTYTVTFEYNDGKRTYKATKEVTIADIAAPVITLKSGDSMMVVLGNKFEEPGYTAIDNVDKDVTSSVKTEGTVDVNKEGVYTLKYTVTDKAGNKGIAKRKVTVTKTSPLTMSVKDFSLKGFYDDAILKETEVADSTYVNETIFAGDSTALYYVMNKCIPGTQLWHKEGVSLETVFTQKIYINHQASNMTLIEAIASKKPKRILLSLGTNSVATMEIDYFITKYEELLKQIKEKSPDTELIVQSIFPVAISYDTGNKKLNNDKINKMNFRLLELCSKLDVPFLNTSEVLKDSNGTLKSEYGRNEKATPGVHLSQSGNKVALDYFKNHIYKRK